MSPCLDTRLGPYEICAFIGVGGMGEVYKAEDTRLGRAVTLKLLPERLSTHRQSLGHFQREAHAASPLNHSNMCAVYDIGEHEGRPYLVMELLDGQTLRECIGGRPMKLDELLDPGIQIADALGCGAVEGHRPPRYQAGQHLRYDSTSGQILDFGLAKLACAAAVEATEASSITNPGATMGTVSDMSPEQARGEELDACTDLFSFGVVL